MNMKPELHRRVLKIISDVSGVPANRIEASDTLVADLGMDSVSSMELLGMLDEELGIEVEIDQVSSIQDVAAILALVSEQVHVL